jgi:hypothetical protein
MKRTLNVDPGFIFHQYKTKRLAKMISDIERSSESDPTRKTLPVLRKYQEIAETFEERWGEENDAGSLSMGAMRGLLDQAEREALEED